MSSLDVDVKVWAVAAQKAQAENDLVCLKGKFNAGILASKYEEMVLRGGFR